jgi:hypothetical protein
MLNSIWRGSNLGRRLERVHRHPGSSGTLKRTLVDELGESTLRPRKTWAAWGRPPDARARTATAISRAPQIDLGAN